ncbi:MAG: hypothetical protein HYV07_06510 [Deltaproteobacteria bacterium]|nr:hypothetical protein [Deltaproteobacteria bacterium]
MAVRSTRAYSAPSYSSSPDSPSGDSPLPPTSEAARVLAYEAYVKDAVAKGYRPVDQFDFERPRKAQDVSPLVKIAGSGVLLGFGAGLAGFGGFAAMGAGVGVMFGILALAVATHRDGGPYG